MTKKLSASAVEEAKGWYEAGDSLSRVAERLGVTVSCIWPRLRAVGTRMRAIHPRKWAVDESFFERLDREDVAYWLGFISGDGCNHRGQAMRVTISTRDEEHLDRLRLAMGSKRPLTRQRQDAEPGRIGRAEARTFVAWEAWSMKMCGDLERLGVVARKSSRRSWPDALPESQARHFCRGYVDANGGLYGRSRGDSYVLRFSVCGNVAFLEAMQQRLIEQCQLNRTQILHRPGIVSWFGELEYSGRRQVSRIFHWLYDGATVWLPRKRERVEKYIYSAGECGYDRVRVPIGH